MTRRRLLALGAIAVFASAALVGTGALAFLRDEQQRLARSRHAAAGETALRVLNPAGAALTLLRAGGTLDGSAPETLAAGDTWLREGRYILEARAPGWRQLFPVAIDASGRGPDGTEGTWTVTLVTWYEANAYGRWLTRRLGGGRWLFRLPTEAEWEKAARGPDGFDYGLGMELSEPQAGLYNWRKNPDAAVTLVDVEATRAAYRPNRYGVYHASGNAREWTQSVFRPYGEARPYADDDRNHDATEGLRVTRGGSWYSASAVRLQLAYREEFQPELSSDDLGFRLAAVLGAGPGR